MLRFEVFFFYPSVEVRVDQPPVLDGEREHGLQRFPQLALGVWELFFLPFFQVHDVERYDLELLLRSFHPFFVVHISNVLHKTKDPVRAVRFSKRHDVCHTLLILPAGITATALAESVITLVFQYVQGTKKADLQGQRMCPALRFDAANIGLFRESQGKSLIFSKI